MDDSTKIGISTQTLVSSTGSDVQPRKLTQLIAGLSVTLGAFALGNALGWTSPTDTDLKVKFNFSDSEISWIASVMPLGATFVVLPCGWSMDMFGRKLTMLGLALPFVAGWLLMVFADPIWMFIVGRFVTGMMGGAFSLTAPAYTSEIADNTVRGMLGSFFQLMVTLGILFVYFLGAVKASYEVITGLCAAIPVCFALIFFFMPETPLQHLRKGREEAARKSLRWFRGPEYDIEDELKMQKDTLEQIEREKLSFLQAFRTRAAMKGLFIAMGLMCFQQLSGVNAVIFFAATIFKDAGSDLDENISTVIIGVVQVIATFVSTQVVDRAGRRVLLLISDSVMCICTVLLGVYFYIDKNDPDKAGSIGWLPLASLCLFIVVFSLGYGPIPWMMVGELFPPNIKGVASSIACMFNWILAFLVTKFFSGIKDGIGAAPTFWIFAGISAVGTVFVFLFVPETKGKSLQQIQIELGGGRVKNEIPEMPSKY